MSSLNIFGIGCSRNTGYYASVRLLEAGATVTFLLRKPDVFDSDETIQKFVKQGTARLVKGDALVQSEVQNAWDVASKESKVDVVLFTVGGQPKFSLSKGFVITPENLVTQSILNTLCVVGNGTQSPELYPRIIAITSTGLNKASHAHLPLLLKPIYSYFLQGPHEDKVGAERVVAHCAGWAWDPETDGAPSAAIMGGEDWQNREHLPKAGELKRVLIVRPALFTDGECLADKAKQPGTSAYRVSTEHLKGWTISRKDVAHFVADAVLNKWDEYEGKRISIAY